MLRLPGFLHRFGLVLAVVTASGFAADRKSFTTSSTLSAEAITLVRMLEEAHYNRDNVTANPTPAKADAPRPESTGRRRTGAAAATPEKADYTQVIPDYMADLDGQRLFFLAGDKAKFAEAGKNVYYNTRYLGNVDLAYDIFYVYQQRVESRIAWIFAELKQDIDLNVKEDYRVDRTKAEWPADVATADDLWRRRLKFELVAELLNKKSVEEARTIVRKRYERMLKNLGEIEGNDLAELFLSTIARLYDPHSTYFSAATYEDFGIQMKLKLVGIGALLGLEEDTCVVREIIPGGPADLGRVLKPGDKIISVAQPGAEPVEIIGMKLRKIVEMIRGQKGTQVHLMVQPADAPDSSVRKEIVITRDEVRLNSARARAAVFQVPDTNGQTQPIGVITLPAFYGPDEGDTDAQKSSASMDVARLIEQLKAEKIQGLVLDLRHNGGGYLTEAIELAGLFIQTGPVVQVKNYAGEVQVDRDTNSRIAYDGPLAVLVDRFSASASEIVAGALQNYGRAIVVGDSSTHGKGTVQMVVEMKQYGGPALKFSQAKTGAAKLTIQKYYLPSGASTQLKGVVPDITLPSINDFIPIGESDLQRALVWDQIQSSRFDGSPLDPKIVNHLKQASQERQSKLEEFAFLRRNVDWFKARQEQQKVISINLEDRQKQKTADDAFRKEMKLEKERIAKGDFGYKPFYLGPPPQPKQKAPKKEGEEDEFDAEEENETYVKADIHLREALRVIGDGIALGKNRELWASNRPPLTAFSRGG